MVSVLKFLAGLALIVMLTVPASAQNCNGQFAAGKLCGNPTGSTQPPSANATIFSMINQNCSSPGQGSVPYLGSSALGCLAPGTAGLPFVSGGASANPAYGILGLAAGGLGGSQAAATVNQIPVYPGSGGAAVPTTINLSASPSTGKPIFSTIGIGNDNWNGTVYPFQLAPITNYNNALVIGKGTGVGGAGISITGIAQNGTVTSPTAITSGQELFFLQAYGWDGTAFDEAGNPPALVFEATEDWTSTARGAVTMFQGVPNGSVNGQNEMSIGNGVTIQKSGYGTQGRGWGTLTVAATTASTSTKTGAVVVAGGIGAGGDINSANANVTTAYKVAGTQVVGARNTGWTAMTGSPDKATAYDTSTVTLAQLAGRVAELQAILTAHGLIGP